MIRNRVGAAFLGSAGEQYDAYSRLGWFCHQSRSALLSCRRQKDLVIIKWAGSLPGMAARHSPGNKIFRGAVTYSSDAKPSNFLPNRLARLPGRMIPYAPCNHNANVP